MHVNNIKITYMCVTLMWPYSTSHSNVINKADPNPRTNIVSTAAYWSVDLVTALAFLFHTFFFYFNPVILPLAPFYPRVITVLSNVVTVGLHNTGLVLHNTFQSSPYQGEVFCKFMEIARNNTN